MKFQYGFEIGGIPFGWCQKELFRLPFRSGRNNYGLRKLDQIMIGGNVGYRVARQKRTIEQLKAITVLMQPVEVSIVQSPELP